MAEPVEPTGSTECSRAKGICEYVVDDWIATVDLSPAGDRLVVGLADGSLCLLEFVNLGQCAGTT